MMRKLKVINQKTKKKVQKTRQPSTQTGWSNELPLGENLQIRARSGFRAAVIDLEPGLYLVSEIRSESLEQPQEIGFALLPLLSAGMVQAAQAALRRNDRPFNLNRIPENLTRWIRRRREPENDEEMEGEQP